jgi:hypothetical protein
MRKERNIDQRVGCVVQAPSREATPAYSRGHKPTESGPPNRFISRIAAYIMFGLFCGLGPAATCCRGFAADNLNFISHATNQEL